MEKIYFNKALHLNKKFLRLLQDKIIQKDFKYYLYNLANISIDSAMVIAPLLAYIFQIVKFNRTKSSQGFSKFICLFLYLGNLLRIFFWLGKRFKITLLYQSIGTVFFQILLVHYFMKYQNKKSYLQDIKVPSTNRQLRLEKKNNINLIKNYIAAYFSKTFRPKFFSLSKIFSLRNFWNWQEELEFYKFMILILIILSVLFSLLNTSNIFLQIIGSLSATFEAVTCLPQVIENCKTKVTKNVSYLMISFWLLGDSFRFCYNLYYKAPIQLIIGMGIMVFFDIVCEIQLIMYRNNNFKEMEKHQNKKQIEEINQLMKSIDELNVAK